MAKSKTKSRRSLLLGLAGLSAVAWGWQKILDRTHELRFAPIPGLPGWRQVETGALSGGSASDAVFAGLGETPVTPLPASELCNRLYARKAPGHPVAVFTDINCPNCRSLETKLAARQDRISVTWWQLPLLGPASEKAALLALAAEHHSQRPTDPPAKLRGHGSGSLVQFYARQSGLDVGFLSEAHEDQIIKDRLHHHRRMAETLGIWGTPAMTIGKTLVMGDMPEATLDALLAMDHPACG